MGIDQQVNGIANQYRSNPQGLQQKYGQNKQLVDLLALQKLKTDKEQAAREMQMQMDPNQQTIAQQREQQVMGLTREEIARQVGGANQQQEAQRQKQMQQMASRGMPQRQGIAAAMPPNPMANRPPQRMAAGGIVALAEGGGPLHPNIGNMSVDDWKGKIRAAMAQGASEADVSSLVANNATATKAFQELFWGEVKQTPKTELAAAREKQTREGGSNPYKDSSITKGVASLKESLKNLPPPAQKTVGTARAMPEDFERANAINKPIADEVRAGIQPAKDFVAAGGRGLESIITAMMNPQKPPEGTVRGYPQGAPQNVPNPNAMPSPSVQRPPAGNSVGTPNDQNGLPYAPVGPPLVLQSSGNPDPMDGGVAAVAEAGGTPSQPPTTQSASPASPWDAEQRETYEAARKMHQIDAQARMMEDRETYQGDMKPAKDVWDGYARGTKDYEDVLHRQQNPEKLKREQLMAMWNGIASTQGTTFGAAAAGAAPGYLNRKNKQEKEARGGIADLQNMRKAEGDARQTMGTGQFNAGIAGRDSGEKMQEAGLEAMKGVSNTGALVNAQNKATDQRAASDDLYRLANSMSMSNENSRKIVDDMNEAVLLLSESTEYMQLQKRLADKESETFISSSDEREIAELKKALKDMRNKTVAPYYEQLKTAERLQQTLSQRMGIPAGPSASGTVDFNSLPTGP